MNLWIRTQNKELLFKVDYIDAQIENGYLYTHTKDGYKCLGEYATKERALEILDEIQNLLTPQIFALIENMRNNRQDTKLTNVFCIDNGNGQLDVKELSTVVYQMPEE